MGDYLKRFQSMGRAVSLFRHTAGVDLHGALVSDVYAGERNLADGCRCYDAALRPVKFFSIKSDRSHNSCITVDLGESRAFNTITLFERGKSVTLFSIYASDSLKSGYELIYQGDTIENGRVCYVGDVRFRYLRIFVIQAEGRFCVCGLGVYNQKKIAADNFRVTAYAVADSITPETDFSALDGVTDLILFGMAHLSAQGKIEFYDHTGGRTDAAAYEAKLALLRDAIGARDIRIIVDPHLPSGRGNSATHCLMTEHLAGSVANIREFIKKYDFSGYDINYEYPASADEWVAFNGFLREIKKAMPDRLLSVAASPWKIRFDRDVLRAIDRVELMTYDIFDTHGYHSPFPGTANGIERLLSIGFRREQIDVGVPFYSRPVNAIEYWGSYPRYAERIGRYENLIYDNTFDDSGAPLTAPQYFNSAQMIADKTAFALDAGVGGIMVWHMVYDVPYDHPFSLFRAIHGTWMQKTGWENCDPA